ncbi:MAG: hypothetical protein KDK37_18600 [Leptospiraceae bacterium]|nr:hypothetical protein [Leptospiraceae bacterium]
MKNLILIIPLFLMGIPLGCATGITEETVLRESYPGFHVLSEDQRFSLGARCSVWRFGPDEGRYLNRECENGKILVVGEWSDFYIARDRKNRFIFRRKNDVLNQKRMEEEASLSCRGIAMPERFFLKSILFPTEGVPGCSWAPAGLSFEFDRLLGPGRAFYIIKGHIIGPIPIIVLSEVEFQHRSFSGGGIFRFESASYQPGVWVNWSEYLAVLRIVVLAED